MEKGKRYIVYFYAGQQYMVPVEMADKFTKEGTKTEKPVEKKPGAPTEVTQPETTTTATTTNATETPETKAPEAQKAPETKAPEAQSTPNEYKIGKQYYFKTLTPGKKGILKVLNKEGDDYTIQIGLDPKRATQQKRSQTWMDQYITESANVPENIYLVAESLDEFLKYDASYEA